MPSNNSASRDARCPFFRSSQRNYVGCEAPFDGAVILLAFENRALLGIQLHTFCNERYQNCEIYQMVMEKKYKENDGK